MNAQHISELAAGTSVVGPGSIVAGKYRIERLIGRGGMGMVFEARHLSIGRAVAIKLLLTGKERYLARFEREARICGTLEHENIVAIHDIGRITDGRPYLVMECVRGVTMRAALQDQGVFPIPRAAGLIRQACRGLSAAHRRGVIHRDIKPENLLMTRRADGGDLLKIVDFGIAHLATQCDASPTTTAPIGTPHYIAPESLSDQAVDERADIYALGVILFELLTGKKPYRGSSIHSVMYNIAHSQIATLRALRFQVSADLQRVVEQALHPKKERRIRSCEQLLEALEPFESRCPESVSSCSTTQSQREPNIRIPDGRSRGRRLASTSVVAAAVSVLVGSHFVDTTLETEATSTPASSAQRVPSARVAATEVPQGKLIPAEHQALNVASVLAQPSALAPVPTAGRPSAPVRTTASPARESHQDNHEDDGAVPNQEPLLTLDRENPYD